MSSAVDDLSVLATTLAGELGHRKLIGDDRRAMAVAPYAVPPLLLAAMLPSLIAALTSRAVRGVRSHPA